MGVKEQVGCQTPVGQNDRIKRIRYKQDPDYTKPIFEIPSDASKQFFNRLQFLYGKEKAETCLPELERIIKVHHAYKPDELIELEKDFNPKERFTEKDMVLITYGDIVCGSEDSPLNILHSFVNKYNQGGINTLHILPFFPYSSDHGFAVVDYLQVDTGLGTWEDIINIGDCYDLMFDGVLNHCSSRSKMFREFLNGDPDFKDFFISYDSPDDLTPEQRGKIFRPRTSDILTRFDTLNGPQYVWTTFSEDQIDLNFRNPKLLTTVLEGLLFYVRQGADLLRLDAVTYIWADPGTDCVHLPETHEIIKLLRDVLELAAPSVAIVTETNVPHEENVSYFGNGFDEAHMVYNFALPPLVLYTFYNGDATAISRWAMELQTPSDLTTFFNFLDSHDGIGVMGVKGILSKEEIGNLIQKAKDNGALISYKMNETRTYEPYEINATWWSAINGGESSEDLAMKVKRYVASRTIPLVLQGVPGVYVHGAIGSENNYELVKQTGHNRDINRAVIDGVKLAVAFNDPDSKCSLIRELGSKFNLIRIRERAFHPHGDQKVLMTSSSVLTVLRRSPEGDQCILTIVNITQDKTPVEITLSELDTQKSRWHDLVNGKEFIAEDGKIDVLLEPYEILWLKPFNE